MARSGMSRLLAGLALCILAAPAFADIYMFKDDKGVVHFTNIPNGDKRFRMVRKEDNTSDYARAAGILALWVGLNAAVPSASFPIA